MSTARAAVEIEYPESDGQPMGETDIHIDWLIRLRDMLKFRYSDQRTYVGADMLLYYVEGYPQKFVVPDVFVVKDCDTHARRVFKLWEEPSAPHVIFEITFRTSQREDTLNKPRTYAIIGVEEYFVFDPTGDYLGQPLLGFRLDEGLHEPIEPDADGWLMCEQLGIRCRVEGEELVLADATTGEKLLPRWQAEQQAREAEQRAREVERRAREQSEAEVARLREELRRLRGENGATS
jgi:Uma2 family endonuclease